MDSDNRVFAVPPMPPMAPGEVGGFQVLLALRRNGYSAFPSDVLLPDGIPTVMRARRALFRRRWKRLISSIIVARRAAKPANDARDLFDLLSEAHGSNREDVLADEVSTMIAAGHETTGLTLFWMCTLLAKLPQWREALATEASGLDLSFEGAAKSLPNLVMARAVVQETLRLYPPAFIVGRLARQTHQICGTCVPQGSIILFPFWMLQRNPRFWAQPATFDPSRFAGGPEPERFTYLPFGAGQHVCIGAQLAMSEATLVIAMLMQKFTLTINGDRPVLPVGALTTHPDHAPTFVLQAR